MISELALRVVRSGWLTKGFWSVTDQTLFALSNFVLNILLARWLSATEYGAWSLAFSGFLLIGAVHTALFAEPMLVFAPSRYRDCLPEYVAVLIRAHWWLLLPVGVLAFGLGVGMVAVGHAVTGKTIAAFGVAGPCILFQWLMRRACYAQLRPDLSASGGLVYMVVVFCGASALFQSGNLSVGLVVALTGGASLISGIWLMRRLRVPAPSQPPGGDDLAKTTLKNHWSYGRWAVAISAVSWIPGNLVYMALPLFAGLQSVAGFRAVFNVLLPIQHLVVALSGLLIPVFAARRGSPRFKRLVLAMLAAFGLLTGVAWIAAGLLGGRLVAAMYRGQYVEQAFLLWLLGAIPVIAGQQAVLGAALRALERPDKVFWPYVLSAAGAMTVGVAMVFWWETTGAAYSLVFSAALSAGAMSVQLWRAWSHEFPAGPVSLAQVRGIVDSHASS